MSEELPDRIAVACEIAAGGFADPNASGNSILAAHKDLNSKGRGPCWYRMVLRNSEWQYFSEERLPTGTFLASDRRATVYGEVFVGELVCSHDKGGPVDAVWLVCLPDEKGQVLVSVEFRKRRDGQLVISLPDGREVICKNPRK